ncbi:hypothetical protein J7643_17410 [bacterium]|nr:hypothetical protein [bacterium]
MPAMRTAKVEPIPCGGRSSASLPRKADKAKILLRMDPTAWGRATRLDLEQQGYAVTSVRTLDAEAIARHAPDAILYFRHAEESPEALMHLPEGLSVIVANVGGAMPAPIGALAETRGYRMLQSNCGPCLHQVMRVLPS